MVLKEKKSEAFERLRQVAEAQRRRRAAWVELLCSRKESPRPPSDPLDVMAEGVIADVLPIKDGITPSADIYAASEAATSPLHR